MRMLRCLMGMMAVLLLAACKLGDDQAAKWRVSLDKTDKKPYGAYLAYNSLRYFFPSSQVIDLSNSYRYDNISLDMMQPSQGKNLMVLVGLDLNISDNEWYHLQNFVQQGNELVIFSSSLDDKIESYLRFYKYHGKEELPLVEHLDDDGDEQDCLTIDNMPGKAFGYNGRWLRGVFTAYTDHSYRNNDTADDKNVVETAPDTLGYARNVPDILRFRIGYGHITIHAAPLAMSNYFLLQGNNIDYLTAFWRTLPPDIGKVYWQNYYKHYPEHSSLDQLLRYPATRIGFLLSIITLLVYILFQMKRRQRQIPIIPPLRNESVAFVETVGRLYYNKGDHRNLADKMIQQFLEWVRLHYYINTNALNEDFIAQLAMKSESSENMVRELVHMIAEIRTGHVSPDDAYLYQLYTTIQSFCKQHT